MTPSLTLEYRPGSGQEFMAAGWTLAGLSLITRCPKSLAHDKVIDSVHLSGADNYCLDGRHLVAIADLGSSVEYRTQPDTFVRVIGHKDTVNATGNVSFELVTPDGVHRSYGGSPDAHIWTNQVDASGGRIAFAWLIDHEWSPATAATIDYVYTNTNSSSGTSSYAPARINYSGRTISFTTIDPSAQDPHFGWQPYRYVANTALVSTIQITAPGAPTHTYGLNYTHGPRTGRTLLGDINETVGGAVPVTRPIAAFEWNSLPASTPHFSEVATPIPSPIDTQNASVELMDVSGDGRPDYLVTDLIGGLPILSIATSGGNNIFNSPQPQLAAPPGNTGPNSVDRAIAIDYNQDGFDDLLRYGNDPNSAQTWKVMLASHVTAGTTDFTEIDTGVHSIFQYGVALPTLVSTPAGAHLADLNGDGVSDLVQCNGDPNGQAPNSYSWTVNYWASTGASSPSGQGFLPGAGTPIPQMSAYPCDVDVAVVDVDGDRRAELVVPSEHIVGTQLWYMESPLLALGARADGSWELVDTQLPLPPTKRTVWLDINGDGLPDAVQTRQDAYSVDNLDVYFNTGGTFGIANTALAADMSKIAVSIDAAIPIELNGDGRQDLLIPLFVEHTPVAWQALQATGLPSPAFQVVSVPELLSLPIYSTGTSFTSIDESAPYGLFLPTSSAQPRASDLNGDGATDLLATQPGVGNVLTFVSTFADEDTLKTVTNGTNARAKGDPLFVPDVSLSYSHLIDAARTGASGPTDETGAAFESTTYLAHWDATNTCAYPRRCFVGPRRVISSYSLNDGEDGAHEYDLRYRDGRADIEGRGWIGFGTRITLDRISGAQTLDRYDNVSAESTTGDYPGAAIVQSSRRWVPAFPSDPDPSRVDITVGTSTRTSYLFPHTGFATTYFSARTSTNRKVYQGDFNPGSGLTMLQWVESIENSGLTPLSDATTSYDAYDAYGNVHTVTTTVAGVDLTTTRTRTYQNDTTAWVLGRALTDITCSTAGGNTQCRTETTTYDGFGRPKTHGFGTTDTDPVDAVGAANAAYSEAFDYDAFGNQISTLKSDNFGHTALTCAAYDPQGIFLQALRDPLYHTTFFAFDARFGERIAEVDANNVATQWGYDGWGRPALELRVTGRNTTTTFAQVNDPSHGTVIRKEVKTAGGQDVTTQYDSAGRPTIVWSGTLGPYCPSPCPKARTTQYAIYDPVHLGLSKLSIPVDESVGVGSVPMWSSWTRDAAGRVTTTVPPWGAATSFSYSGNTTTISEPLSVIKSRTVDAAGRLLQVVEPAGVTAYSYGPFSEVTQILAQGSLTKQWSDPVGHIVQLTTPDAGTTTRTYDGFGHPMVETDALARKTTFSVDVAGRLQSRADSDGIALWTWDSGANAIGQLVSVSTSATGAAPFTSREDYTYDKKEQLQSHTLTVGGESFGMTFTYAQGNVDTVTYPPTAGGVAFSVKNDYDPYGHLAQVSDPGKLPYWTLNAGDNEGHTTTETFGNGVQTMREFWLDKDAPRSIVSSKGGTSLQSLRYAWDSRVNLTSRRDDHQTAAFNSEIFKYDSSDRLTCASFSGACTLAVVYDPSGNIKSKTGLGSYTYDTGHPHAVKTAGTDAYGYDLVGNQIRRPDADITYNAANLPSQITAKSGAISRYLYDGFEDRIQKTTASDTTVYLGGLFERVAHSDGSKDYYYSISSGERVVAILTRHVAAGGSPTTTSVSYIHVDHLGSPDVITNEGGVKVDARSFDAFGKPRNADWSVTTAPPSPSLLPVAYTGQEADSLGLVDMKGRTYDPRLGRMLQADPFVGHPTGLQGWNRYAYVENNPLKFVDPSGFDETPVVAGTFEPEGASWGQRVTDSASTAFYLLLGSMYSGGVGEGEDAASAPTTDTAPTGPGRGYIDPQLLIAIASPFVSGGAGEADSLPYHVWKEATSANAIANPLGEALADGARLALGEEHVALGKMTPSSDEEVRIGIDIALSAIPVVGEELGLLGRTAQAAGAAPRITSGSQVTEGVIREAMKDAPLVSQQAGGVSLPRVQQYVDRLLAGKAAPAIKVDGQMLVDGNHRYIAGRILGQEPPIQLWSGGRPAAAVPWDKLPISPEFW